MAYQETHKKVEFRIKPWVIRLAQWVLIGALFVGPIVTLLLSVKDKATIRKEFATEIGEYQLTIKDNKREIAQLKSQIAELDKEKIEISTELKVKDKLVQQLLNKISELERSRKVINVPDGSVLKIENQKVEGHDQQ
jgi:septal ring factor EnvC (AmiA/AmiB activator)